MFKHVGWFPFCKAFNIAYFSLHVLARFSKIASSGNQQKELKL
nr:MAG TPA: putative cellulose synthase A catalytic synthase, plant conserved region [Caudoviricetes sp.]